MINLIAKKLQLGPLKPNNSNPYRLVKTRNSFIFLRRLERQRQRDMSSFTIPSSSSFSLSNVYTQPSRHGFTLFKSRSNFEFLRLRFGVEARRRTCLQCNCSSKGTGGTDSSENLVGISTNLLIISSNRFQLILGFLQVKMRTRVC